MNDLAKEEYSPVDQKQIDENIKKMIQSFIKLILPFVSNKNSYLKKYSFFFYYF